MRQNSQTAALSQFKLTGAQRWQTQRIIMDAYGVPAIFVGSKTGRDDAPFVFARVGGEERRMRWSEWDALPA